MRLLGFRFLSLLAAISAASLMLAALYFQHVQGLEPCPLCVAQRVFVIIIGLIGLLAFLHNPGAEWIRRIYLGATLLTLAGGIATAGRHVWLQSLPPDRVPECGPGLQYILDNFPFSDALGLIFKGSGECAKVTWTFLGLSMPGWLLLIFAIMFVIGLARLVAGARAD
ncbi:MAG TPA: disulfide bond formation protein B [Gammaproteobacteria bacterium]|nr:disulfide bond formation protein B [Gammaproteobacteria bacterium]